MGAAEAIPRGSIDIPGSGKYLVFGIKPDLSGLTQQEAKIILPGLEAFQYANKAFYEMMGGKENLERQEFLDAIYEDANPDIQVYATLHTTFGGPWLTTGNLGQLPRGDAVSYENLKEAAEAAGQMEAYEKFAGQIVQGLGLPEKRPIFSNIVTLDGEIVPPEREQEIKEEINRIYEAGIKDLPEPIKRARQSPLARYDTRINFISEPGEWEGGIEETSYFDSFREHLEPAVLKFEEAADAAKEAGYTKLSAYLRKAGQSLIYGNQSDGVDLLMTPEDSEIVFVAGPIEQYILQKFDNSISPIRSNMQLTLCKIDREATKELKRYEDNIENLQKQVPEEYRNENPNISLFHVNIIHNAGESAHIGMTYIAQQLPNDDVNKQVAPVIFSYTDLIPAVADTIATPIADIILAEEIRENFKDPIRAFQNLVSLHEIGHAVNKRKAYNQPLEEGKANIIAYRHGEAASLSQEEIEEMAAFSIIDGLRGMRRGYDSENNVVRGAHNIAANMFLNMQYEFGGITVDDEGKFNINQEKYYDGLDFYLDNTYKMEFEGDEKVMQEFVDEWSNVDERTVKAIDSLKEVPLTVLCVYDADSTIEAVRAIAEPVKAA